MQYIAGKTDCAPEEVGFDSGRIEVLRKHFEKLMDKKIVLGASYCVSRKGKVFLNESMGRLSYRDEKRLLKPGSMFQIRSITKLFTAVSIMKLVEEGLLRLNTPVGEILPQFNEPPFDKIEIFHLLTHTSGLYPDPNCFGEKHNPGWWSLVHRYLENHNPEDGEIDWITPVLALGLRRPVGAEWMYSTFGFATLGVIIEKLSGKFAHDYITDEIVKPLGLKDTTFDLTADMAKNHVILDEWQERDVLDALEGCEKSEWKKLFLKAKAPNTGAGLHSTIWDVNRFGNMLLNKGRLDGARILGRKSVEKMLTCALANIPDYCWGSNEKDRRFGLGFDMKHGKYFITTQGTWNHEGYAGSFIYADPAEEMVFACFAPHLTEWNGEAMYNTTNIAWSGLM